MGSEKIFMFGEPSTGGRADLTAILPALMNNNKGIDPNILAMLGNRDGNDRDLLAACNIKRFGLQEQNLLFNKKPVAHGGSDVEVPTMDDRQEIDLKSSVPVKRQYIKV